MYNPVDYYRFIWHTGQKTIFWAGSDIINLGKRPGWRYVIANTPARHICENKVEQSALFLMGIHAEIHPCLIDKLDIYPSFRPARRPQVYLVAHPGREEEYGVEEFELAATLVPTVGFHIYGIDGISHRNVKYHGKVPSEQFQKEIESYHAAVRLNAFDGFSEILARSILMGQYPISRIEYPNIDYAPDFKALVHFITELKYKYTPNFFNRAYWQMVLSEVI